MQIDYLDIDERIVEKIESRHGVTFAEVEEAAFSDRRHIRRGRQGLYVLLAQTDAGRYLTVVLASLGGGVWRVVTARDMTRPERQIYQQARGD
jgi:uncharacterized DUF497 family protein